MAETLLIEVVTPEKAVLTGHAEEVVLPGTTGQMGILPGHLPLLSGLDVGELVVRGFKGAMGKTAIDGERRFFVDGGFVEVLPGKVSVMTELCDGFDEIDIAAARTAIEEAERELLSLEEKSKAEEIEVDVLQQHQETLRRARMRLLFSESDE